MTAPAPDLPQDVERALTDFEGVLCWAKVETVNEARAALRAAILAGMRAATEGSGAASAASAGSAAHVAPPVSASFDAALAGLDVENDYAPDRGTTYAIVGLDDVRAAHAEAVEQAVIDEQDACVRVLRAFLEQCEPGDDVRLTLEQAEQNIRARGAKS